MLVPFRFQKLLNAFAFETFLLSKRILLIKDKLCFHILGVFFHRLILQEPEVEKKMSQIIIVKHYQGILYQEMRTTRNLSFNQRDDTVGPLSNVVIDRKQLLRIEVR